MENTLPTIPTIDQLRDNPAADFQARSVANIVAIFRDGRDGIFTNFVGHGVAEVIGWKRSPGVSPDVAKTLILSDGTEQDHWCDTMIPVILVPNYYG